MKHKLFVIIVTYNAMKWIDVCLRSVAHSTYPSTTVVIDNGSKDDTVSYIREHYPQTVILPNDNNIGFGKANNIGLQYALEHGCTHVYLLNQDAWVGPNTFERLISISISHPEYGILSPIQITADKLSLDTNFAYCCKNTRCPQLLDHCLLGMPLQDIYEIKFVMAAHWLMTRKCLLQTGGFNPVFPHYGEDDNYISRMQWHHLKAGICPAVYAIHDRQHRIQTKRDTLHMNFIYYLITLSNINTSFAQKMAYYIEQSCKNVFLCFRHRSIKPFIIIFRVIAHLHAIRRCNHIAKTAAHPFLQINTAPEPESLQ